LHQLGKLVSFDIIKFIYEGLSHQVDDGDYVF